MKFKRLNQPQFLLVLGVMVFGVIMVLSSSSPYGAKTFSDSLHFFKKHIVFSVLTIAMMLVVSFIDYRIYRKFAVPLFIISFIACGLVFSPLGKVINNARRWIFITESMTFMPSDLMKIGAVFFMAKWLVKNKKNNRHFVKGFLPTLAIIGAAVSLIYLQPNFSTTLALVGTLFLMYIVSGMNLTHFIPTIVFGAVFIYLAFQGEANAYRFDRVLTFINPLATFLTTGWQLSQALFAVSTGGLFGLGFGQSRQKFLYISEAHNDFIFAIICEELGFLGGMLVIVAFLVFVALGVRIAMNAPDYFGFLTAIGLTTVIGLQAFIHVAVVLGLAPTTGLPLPFISYGGTSIVMMGAMVGILMNISVKGKDAKRMVVEKAKPVKMDRIQIYRGELM